MEADKARLAEVGVLLDAVNEDQRDLYDERLALWRRLKEAGIPAGELARLAGVLPGTLKTAMAEARRRDESRSAAPAG